MMNGACVIGAYLLQSALAFALCHDGFGGEFAGLKLRPFCLFLVLGLVLPDRDVLVARKNGTSLHCWPIRRADLHELGLGSDGDSDMRLHLHLIAARIGASVLFAEIGKQQLVMPGALGAIDTASGRGNQLRVPLVERSLFQKQQHVRLNPEAQVADGQQDSRGLVAIVGVDLFEASRKSLYLHLRWQLRQQDRVTYADVVLIERGGNLIAQVGELQPRGDVDGRLADLRRNLLDGVGGFRSPGCRDSSVAAR